MRILRTWSLLSFLAYSCFLVRAQEPDCVAYLKPRFLSDNAPDQKTAAQYRKVMPRGSILRFVLPVLGETKLIVYEPPNPEHDQLEPDTHLILLHGIKVAKRMSFSEMGIRKEYRVVAAGRLCSGDKSVIYLASGAGATGASEIFVALVFDVDGVRAFRLPEANQGRLELFDSNPFTVTLWSAANEDMGYCGACPKHYDVSKFLLEPSGFKKAGSRRTQRTISPDPLIDRPLILHGTSEPQPQAPSL